MDCPPPSAGNDEADTTAVISGDQETLKSELGKAKEQEACLIIIRGTPQGHRFFIDPARDDHRPRPSGRHHRLRPEHLAQARQGLTEAGRQGHADRPRLLERHLRQRQEARTPAQSVMLAKEDMIKLGNSILKFLPAGELEILFYGNLGSAAHTDPAHPHLQQGLPARGPRGRVQARQGAAHRLLGALLRPRPLQEGQRHLRPRRRRLRAQGVRRPRSAPATCAPRTSSPATAARSSSSSSANTSAKSRRRASAERIRAADRDPRLHLRGQAPSRHHQPGRRRARRRHRIRADAAQGRGQGALRGQAGGRNRVAIDQAEP